MAIGASSIGEVAIGEIRTGLLQADIPAATVTVSSPVPAVASGGGAHPPTATVAITANAPSIRAGKREAVPAAIVAITANAPRIAHSATVKPPSVTVAASALSPRITTGAGIHVSNTIALQDRSSSIADHAIAEFSIAGGGDLQSRTVQLPPRIVIQAMAPTIRGGRRVAAPAALVTAAGVTPEIAARARRVTALFVAS